VRKQRLLRCGIVAKDTFAPQLAHCVEAHANIGQPRQISAEIDVRRCDRALSVAQTTVDAHGVYGGSWIDARPAARGDPHLIPGMRVALAHDPIVRILIVSASDIAGHDAGGDACGAHQHGERGRIVTAKSAFRLE
jgi:hypothetical protein